MDLCFYFGLPGDLAYEAWKQEKLISAYEARKKLEMMGAMTFSSAARETEQCMKDLSSDSGEETAVQA